MKIVIRPAISGEEDYLSSLAIRSKAIGSIQVIF
jgi:hypothetical protein